MSLPLQVVVYGLTYRAVGRGKHPPRAIAKSDPNAMVYFAEPDSWLTEFGTNFTRRDTTLDEGTAE